MMHKSSPDNEVWVVVVTHNAARWLGPLLSSLAASTIVPRIVVVDNNSSDNSVADLQVHCPNVVCIPLEHNLGFGQANNVGIQHALDAGAEFIFLLNQDVKTTPDTIATLVSAAKQYPEYGLLCPLHLNYDGDSIDPFTVRSIADTARPYFSDLLFRRLQPIYDIDFMCAAAWFLRRQVCQEVGGFDPLFFMYGEDDELAARIRWAGWRLGLVPAASICHWHVHENDKRRHALLTRQETHKDYVLRLKRMDHSLAWNCASVLRMASSRCAAGVFGLHWGNAAVAIKELFRLALRLPQVRRSRHTCATSSAPFLRQESDCGPHTDPCDCGGITEG